MGRYMNVCELVLGTEKRGVDERDVTLMLTHSEQGMAHKQIHKHIQMDKQIYTHACEIITC
jgi:hypothetical protein